MKKLSKREIKKIEELLREGKELPIRYREILFPESQKKEYELIYDGKARDEDILAETMRVPLQPVGTFFNHKKTKNGWTNKLIFGDNLQTLKEIYADQQGENILGTKNKIKLIYIDPPFATKQEFRGSQDQKAYQDKITGAKFLEFLRKRLIFLREILADDGCIYVHLDYRKMHYLKVLLDEILGEQNFRNEIIVRRTQKNFIERDRIKAMNIAYDSILFYVKHHNTKIKPPFKEEKRPETWHAFDAPNWAGTRPNLWYKLFGHLPPSGSCWRWTKERTEKAIQEGKLRPNPRTGRPEYLVPAREKALCTNLWDDITAYSFKYNFPTEKSEKLLERIIEIASNSGDIVLDAFAGSGTTGAVAEKLGRKWIMVDSSKLAIYTTQKRLLNLRKEIGNRGQKITPKYFTLYNAGLYDYKKLKDLSWEKYREFVLKLFQCRNEKHSIAGVELDGYFQEANVSVFNYQKYKDVVLDYGFIDNLHEILADKVGKRFFIVAPAASVNFSESYVSKDDVQYYILRIPYSIIDELHRPGGWRIFEKLKQPKSERDINDIAEGIGFDFIRMPEMKCKYYLRKIKGMGPLKLDKGKLEAVIKIQKFESTILSKEPLQYKNLETLSMVMIDYNYDGKLFDLDEVFYSEDLQEQNYEIRLDPTKISKQTMIIYCDLFGNEKKEIKTLNDFKK